MFHLFQTSIAIFFSRCCTYFKHMLQQYVPNISAVSVLCCSKWFHVASCNFRCFICFTHMLQMYVPNVSSIFRRFLYSNVFQVASFYVVRTGATQGQADWACCAPGGWRTVALRSGCAGGVLVLSCSSRFMSAARAEWEEGVRGDQRAQRWGEVRTWDGVKANRIEAKTDRAGYADVRTSGR